MSRYFSSVCFFLFSFSLFAFALEDNVSVRFSYRKELLSDLVSDDLESRIITPVGDGKQGRVRFQFNRQEGNLYYFFSNELIKGVFPLYSTGSYIIRKDEKGKINQIKIFLLNRSDSFIRLTSDKGRTLASVEILGKVVYSHIYISKTLSYFALASLEELKSYLKPSLDISFIFPRYQLVNQNVLSMVKKIRVKLNDFSVVKDGAMDSKGCFVHISDGSPQRFPFGFNCSGFVKWIADGIYEESTGQLLSINRLKRRLLESRGSIETLRYEQTRDPYFGLDWTRNIATVLSVMDENKVVSGKDSEKQDIKNLPFLTYVEDRGFPLEDVELALYILAVNNPGNFYFGSISTPYGLDPVLIQHRHVTVLFPWIDEQGFFRISVMDVNKEIGISDLKQRYEEGYINLIGTKATENFQLRPLSSDLGKLSDQSMNACLACLKKNIR